MVCCLQVAMVVFFSKLRVGFGGGGHGKVRRAFAIPAPMRGIGWWSGMGEANTWPSVRRRPQEPPPCSVRAWRQLRFRWARPKKSPNLRPPCTLPACLWPPTSRQPRRLQLCPLQPPRQVQPPATRAAAAAVAAWTRRRMQLSASASSILRRRCSAGGAGRGMGGRGGCEEGAYHLLVGCAREQHCRRTLNPRFSVFPNLTHCGVLSLSSSLSPHSPRSYQRTCSICHCPFTDAVDTPCEHTFCGNCIRRWLAQSSWLVWVEVGASHPRPHLFYLLTHPPLPAARLTSRLCKRPSSSRQARLLRRWWTI